MVRAMDLSSGRIVATHRSSTHTFSKVPQTSITLVAGLGVAGDAHQGVTVKHRSRVAKDPTQPNLRQVHLVPTELHDALLESGFEVGPGRMGENLTTEGIDLNSLPTGAVLTLGETAQIRITGLRNPCQQLDGLHPGLMKRLIRRDEAGNIVRLAGVMSVVVTGGEVRPGDPIRVTVPDGPHQPLVVV